VVTADAGQTATRDVTTPTSPEQPATAAPADTAAAASAATTAPPAVSETAEASTQPAADTTATEAGQQAVAATEQPAAGEQVVAAVEPAPKAEEPAVQAPAAVEAPAAVDAPAAVEAPAAAETPAAVETPAAETPKPDEASSQVAAATGPVAPVADPSQAVIEDLKTVTVVRGDSLWRISRKVYGRGIRYTTIYDANTDQIRNPRLIYPGQVFVVPNQATTP
jgi:nucleoid-associated protein YgaU